MNYHLFQDKTGIKKSTIIKYDMDIFLLLVMFMIVYYYSSPFVFLQFIIHQISLFFPVQQKQVEIERVPKWLKMLKNWSKYRNSDRVSFTSRGCDHFFENQREQCDVAQWRSRVMLKTHTHTHTHTRTHAHARTHARTHTHTHTHLHLLLVCLCADD